MFNPNEKVRLTKGLKRVVHQPKLVEGKVSSTGKSIKVGKHRLQGDDLERLLNDRFVIRGNHYYTLYTPEKHRKQQKHNRTEPQQRGGDFVRDTDELPPATHQPK